MKIKQSDLIKQYFYEHGLGSYDENGTPTFSPKAIELLNKAIGEDVKPGEEYTKIELTSFEKSTLADRFNLGVKAGRFIGNNYSYQVNKPTEEMFFVEGKDKLKTFPTVQDIPYDFEDGVAKVGGNVVLVPSESFYKKSLTEQKEEVLTLFKDKCIVDFSKAENILGVESDLDTKANWAGSSSTLNVDTVVLKGGIKAVTEVRKYDPENVHMGIVVLPKLNLIPKGSILIDADGNHTEFKTPITIKEGPYTPPTPGNGDSYLTLFSKGEDEAVYHHYVSDEYVAYGYNGEVTEFTQYEYPHVPEQSTGVTYLTIELRTMSGLLLATYTQIRQ